MREWDTHNMLGGLWFTSPENTPRGTCPNEIFVRFVANNYHGRSARFLDIGSGSGANSRYLEDFGFEVDSIDKAPESRGGRFHIIADVAELKNGSPETFDCIFDINTLCHVTDPPYAAIHRALKSNGKFFSITPALGTDAIFLGKGYTRTSSHAALEASLGPIFSKVDIRPANYPSREGNISSWVIEADK